MSEKKAIERKHESLKESLQGTKGYKCAGRRGGKGGTSIRVKGKGKKVLDL